MAKKTATHTCFDRIIRDAPHKQAVQDFHAAIAAHNVEPEKLPTLSADHPVSVAYMAVITGKRWPNGSTVTCRFLDGQPAWQAKVIEKAKMWEQYANIKLDFGTDPNAKVRISFFADAGSWSAIGTDCENTQYFPADQPTMNYGWLRDDTPDEEYERVVVHEFGHALGCIHEHQSPKEHLDWNVQAVYDTFSKPPNSWSKDEIDQNILQKYSPKGISATLFDRASIMLYEFDGSLFKSGVGTPLNEHLSALDEKKIQQMYPK
jgi:hypothetical protein